MNLFIKLIAFMGSILIFSLITQSALAGKITMINTDTQKVSSGKTLYIYSNSIYSFQFVVKGKCPYSKTFDTKDSH